MKKIMIFILFFLLVSSFNLSFAQGLEERFKDNSKLNYKVFYNGIFSGHINWSYLGKDKIGNSQVDVLRVSSDASVFRILELNSQEDIFLDRISHLPLKVKREVLFSGKEESIEEIYNQDKGYVRITYKGDEPRLQILRQKKPIHNILALLYFFPQEISLEKNKWMIFNLPTQQIKIKFVKERTLKLAKAKHPTYFLLGRGAKRFSLWLDKETRLPLRLEFISVLGKVTIVREDK